MSEEMILSCKGLTKRYGAFTALNNLNLELKGGRIVGLLGPNGSGKSTLIKVIAGLLSPNSGEITICGEHPGEKTKAIVSYLPERSYLQSWMKVKDLVDLFEDFYQDFDRQRAIDMLTSLHLPLDARIRTLSKGNKEKVQLIVVVARRAKLYLLDEPLGGVDPAARDYILNTIIRSCNDEACVLLSTHLIWDIEKVLDEAVFLNMGAVGMHDTTDNLREQYGKSVDALFREVYRC